MDLIEVDPQLFVKCRLCLKDLGQYQIIPILQEQIKFCFDIDVNPYDGLPQLLCKTCKNVVNDYFTVKTEFVVKQQKLKINLTDLKETVEQPSDEPQHEAVSSSQQPDEVINDKSVSMIKRSSPNISNLKENLTEKRSFKQPKYSWKNVYTERIVCRICGKIFRTVSMFKRHLNVHDKIMSQHHGVLNKTLHVVLNKVDNAPNITGLSNTVVCNENKIIANDGKSHLYTVYYTINKNSTCWPESDSTKLSVHNRKRILLSDSSDEDKLCKKSRRRRQRIMSRSSGETVVIDREINQGPLPSSPEKDLSPVRKPSLGINTNNDGECINIDDSSDEDVTGNIGSTQNNCDNNVNISDKAIEDIIFVCHNKYVKRFEMDNELSNNKVEKHSITEAQLKHKVLSFGMKTITSQGLNCTGLLRYLEHKNIDIQWIPINLVSATYAKENDNIRICIKEVKRNIIENDNGWQKVPFFQDNNKRKDLKETKSKSKKEQNSQREEVHADDQTEGGDLVCLPMNPGENKLLNESPVPNPKQLPKKFTEILFVPELDQGSGTENQGEENDICIEFDNDLSENNSGMPIITSTTSLAGSAYDNDDGKDSTSNVNENQTDESTSNAAEVSKIKNVIPRLKVKPVSELMPANNINPPNTQSTWSMPSIQESYTVNVNSAPQSQNFYYNSPMPLQVLGLPDSSNDTGILQSAPHVVPHSKNGPMLTLHTAELPNMKTQSPFDYFRTLLRIHGISFIEANSEIIVNFTCLIRFRLLYSLDTNRQPVNLFLSLYCDKSAFSIHVKGVYNDTSVQISKLNANWQWEILRSFRGEVVPKLLQTAQKVSRETYDYTNTFVCLLKSITVIPDSCNS